MYAITVSQPGDPEVLQWQQIETPAPAAGELLIKVTAAGVNRADLLQRQGNYPPPAGASTIIGLECSGTVAELGEGVEGWQQGDECVALLAGGGYAQYVVVPTGQVIAPPKNIDLITAGGLLEVAGTVSSNLSLAALASGESFLVHGGAGGIGSFAIQYAKEIGAGVFTTAGSTEKLAHCRSLGAEHAVSYRDDWVKEVKELTDGRGVDVLLDIMGASYLEQNLDLLAPDGRLVIIGMQGGRKGTLNIGALLAKRGQIIATGLRARPVDQKAAICRQVAEHVWPLYRSGRIQPPSETRIPMAEAARAHTLLESGAALGKIILVVEQPEAGTHGG